MTDIDLGGPASPNRRPASGSLLALVVGAMTLFGLGAVGWVLLDSMNPAVDSRAPLSIDLRSIPVGHRETIVWRDVPIFIAHRTAEEIAAARAGDGAEMLFREDDADRVLRDDWLVVVGIDTFHGWHPISGQSDAEERGDWGGWQIVGEGIHYDTSGRLRRGPGDGNLFVPSYMFVSDTRIEFDWPGLRAQELHR